MINRIILLVSLITAGASACLPALSEPGDSHFGSGSRKILFIGNSLTGANDLGDMVVALAESAKVKPLPRVDVHWLPDFALIDHWKMGDVQKLIADNHYDIVVLQQGPSSVQINRDSLRLVAKLFAPVIRKAGGMPALFSVWPTADRAQDFDRATESYQLAADDIGAAMFPGGEVWRAAWRRNPQLQLYSPDGLHPSGLGTYAVALSIVGILYDRSAIGLPATFTFSDGQLASTDTATARILQESADEANAKFGRKGTP